MKVVFIKDYTANAYLDSTDPQSALLRIKPLPELFFKSGDEIDIDEVTNFDKSTSYVLTHSNGKYLIEKDAVEEKKENVNIIHVALLAAVVAGGFYLLFFKK